MSDILTGKERFSEVIVDISSRIPEEGIFLKDFLDIIGERGLFISNHDFNCPILTTSIYPRV